MDLNQAFKKLEDFKKSITQLSVYDLNCYTAIELYYMIASKINEVIVEMANFEGVVADELVLQSEKITHLLGGMLKEEVKANIDKMVDNGELSDILANAVIPQIVDFMNFSKENLSLLKLRFIYDAKCVGGNTDDTVAIQNFIDELEANGKGGIIQLPYGEIRIDGLKFKKSTSFTSYNNKIIIRGQGMEGTKLICDENSNINFIDFQGNYDTNAGNHNREQCAYITFEDIGILCTNTGNMNRVGINFFVTQYCDLKNVSIKGFKGGGLKFTDSYDSNFYNVNVTYCGHATADSYKPAIGIYGKFDCSNALHFTNCRVEFCPILLLTEMIENYSLSSRHVYFDNCKFEKMSENNSSISPIYLASHNEWGFNNCMFINSSHYASSKYVCDNGLHFMKIDNVSPSYVKGNNQLQNTKFVNCDFICPKLTYTNWGKFISTYMVNCMFSSCYGMSDQSQCFYFRGQNSFKNVSIASEDSKLILLEGESNNIEISYLQLSTANQPLVKLMNTANNNKVIIGGSTKAFTTDYVSLNDPTNDFLQNNKVGRWHIKNNIININNRDNEKEITSNGESICNVKNMVVCNTPQLNYLIYGYEGQEIILKAKQDTLLKHEYPYLTLKNGADKTLYRNGYIKLKNINGNWHEL